MNTLAKELEDSEHSIIDCDRIRYNETKGTFVDFFEESNFVNAIKTFGWRCSPIFRIANKGNGLEGHSEKVEAVHLVFIFGDNQHTTLRYYQMERSKDE